MSREVVLTVCKLLLLSLAVGIVLDWLNLSPEDVFEGFGRWLGSIFGNAWEFARNSAGYVLTGAVIVVPLWLIVFLLGRAKRR